MQKRILRFLLCLCMVLSLVPLTARAADTNIPSGYTAISTPEELNNIRNNLSGKYILTADIDLTSALSSGGSLYNNGSGWIALGYDADGSSPFTGVLDGNGHTIKGILFSAGNTENFGHLIWKNQGTIKNLTLSGTSKLCGFCGVFCYKNDGTILNCHSKVTINNASCYCDDDFAAGGIADINTENGVIDLSSNQADITRDARNNGGSGEHECNIGGIVGMNYGQVTRCWNTGDITVTSEQAVRLDVAGIVGLARKNSSISNVYNTGTISATGTKSGYSVVTGGILGETYSSNEATTITNAFNVGKVSAKANYSSQLAGSITGYVAEKSYTNYLITHKNCYYLSGTASYGTNQTNPGRCDISGVTVLSQSEFYSSSNFSGFNFSSTWKMGWYYPVIRIPCTHSLTKYAATSATCTEDGNILYYYCPICDLYFKNASGSISCSKEDVIIPGGHVWTEKIEDDDHLVEGTGADCQHAYEYYYDCANCDAISTTDTFASATTGPHDVSHEWTTSDGKHFHGCNVIGCEYAEDTGMCVDENHNHECDTCGATVSNCADTDKNHECDICGETMGEHVCDQDIVAEKYLKSTANCQSAAVYYKSCSYCGAASKTDTFTHGELDSENHTGTLGDWQHDADKHWKEYSCCGAHAEETAHNDDNHNHACDTCGAAVSECADTNNDHHCDVCDKELSKCVDSNKDHKCDICGEATGEHKAAEGSHICDYCGKAASECVDENKDHKCDVCGETMGEHKAADGSHDCAYCGKPVTECADDDKDHSCDVCGKELSDCADDNHDGKCDICGKVLSYVTRLSGKNRYITAIKVADELKEVLGVEKFDTIIVAAGENFADALSGSYLSTMKNAPILLCYNGSGNHPELDAQNIAYIKANLAENGTVYILGGTAAVNDSYESELANYNVERLRGKNRFGTNQAILEEAGIPAGSEILVCTAYKYADSLSASATGKPILLVHNQDGTLYGVDEEFLSTLENCSFTIIGGTGAVGSEFEEILEQYGTVNRLSGKTRYQTSVLVAETYFDEPTTAVMAYAWNYPDGLCGGTLAHAKNAPLILTQSGSEDAAVAYTTANNIHSGYVLGGAKFISNDSARTILGLSADFEVVAK